MFRQRAFPVHPASRSRRMPAGGGAAPRACWRGGYALLALLALSVWIAATLGLVHRTLHAPESRGIALQAGVVNLSDAGMGQQTAVAADKVRHSRGIFALFGDHSVSDCNLYDQFAGWHVPMSVPPVVLPIVLPAATFAWLQGEALARWVALFDARGPPSTR